MPDSMATPSLSTDCSCAPGSISAVQTKPQRGGGLDVQACSRTHGLSAIFFLPFRFLQARPVVHLT